jgi:hypothetical protein
MAQDNFDPPLTTEQLHDIGVRRDPGDIIPLLWEIKRLRALVLRADQVVKGISTAITLSKFSARNWKASRCWRKGPG